AFTMGEAIDELRNGQGDRPDPSVLPSIEEWILLQASNRIALTEARRRLIASDPEWRRQLDEAVNGYILEAYYKEEVAGTSEQRPEHAQQAYDPNRPRFDQLEPAKLLVITSPDSPAAAHFGEHAMHAKDLRAAAAMAPGPPPVEELELSFPAKPID